ncbi:MAG: hypothetical protein KJ072_19555 [Verrucomicrobia bacterium]|nr:hypothetical protein [Verrucomicrobiota bacterium]
MRFHGIEVLAQRFQFSPQAAVVTDAQQKGGPPIERKAVLVDTQPGTVNDAAAASRVGMVRLSRRPLGNVKEVAVGWSSGTLGWVRPQNCNRSKESKGRERLAARPP